MDATKQVEGDGDSCEFTVILGRIPFLPSSDFAAIQSFSLPLLYAFHFADGR